MFELPATSHKMAVFIVYEEIRSELKDTCRDWGFQKEPNKSYNCQNEKLSGQVLPQFGHSERKLINWQIRRNYLEYSTKTQYGKNTDERSIYCMIPFIENSITGANKFHHARCICWGLFS